MNKVQMDDKSHYLSIRHVSGALSQKGLPPAKLYTMAVENMSTLFFLSLNGDLSFGTPLHQRNKSAVHLQPKTILNKNNKSLPCCKLHTLAG
jgi:hypothetical protein